MSAATSYFSSRTKAVDRVGRIRSDMDRSSAYILGNSSSSTDYSKYRSSVGVDPVKIRARRDSSLGASYRCGTSSSRRDSYVPSSPIVSRRRESSIATMTPTLTRRGSAVITPVSGLGSETAKYNREQSIQEIKSQFDKQFQETQKKMRVNVGSDDVGEERMNKARAKILGTSADAWDNQFTKRNCLSEMYTEMKRFSTKTVAAINSVADCDFTKRKEDYNWRKDLESYEKSREFERDLRTRSIEGNRRRREQKENELNYQNNSSSSSNNNNRRSSSTSTAETQAKRPPLAPTTITSNNNSNSSSSYNATDSNNNSSSGGGRKSWRDRFNEKQEQQKKKVMEEFSAEAEDRAKKLVASQLDTPSLSTKASDVSPPTSTASPASAAKAKATAKKTSNSNSSQSDDLTSESTATTTASTSSAASAKPVSEVAKKRAAARKAAAASKVKENSNSSSNENGGEEKVTAAKDQESKEGEEGEDEDVHGTRKMKSDFDSMMSNLDQEMEAGRSKLAKLREKIRRTKANIKAADDAEAAEDAKRAEAKAS